MRVAPPRFRVLLILLAAAVLLGSAAFSGAQTSVSGTISTNTTWTVAGSPYIVTGSLYVSGSPVPTLTIQAGVTVKFNSGAYLVVSYPSGGVLQAVGTSGSPILFTANGSTTPGFWSGVYLGNLTPTASQVSYATVEYGGFTPNNRGGLHLEGSSPTIDHVTVRNSLIGGITVNVGSPAITNATLTGNSGPGLLVQAGSASISGSSITSNSGNGIDVSGGTAAVTGDTITGNTGYAISAAATGSLTGLTGLTVSGNGPGKDLIERRAGTMAASQTWIPGPVPYVVTGALYVSGSPVPTLTIQAGVTVKFNAAAYLVVSYPSGGVLQAVGTSGSPILFTANGSTTPGFWSGIYLGNLTATASQVSYATVEYGGFTPNNRGGLHAEGSSPTIDHVTVRNSLIAGITVNGGSPTITNGTLTGNSGPGLLVQAGNASISSSSITGNTGYAISAAATGSLTGLTGLMVSGNGPGKDLIERRAGTMSASQTWVLGSIPYVVTGSLLVEGSPMPVLTIQAGVTVKFNTVSELVVNYNNSGSLQAIGTSAAPILFTANGSTTPGFWYGLYFGANAGGATASHITYATVEYGGQSQYSRGGIYVWNSSPALDHVTLRNNLIAGVVLNGGSASITNSTITGNSGPGLSVVAGSSSISSTSITSNSGNGLDLSGGSVAVTGDTITGNTGYAISAAATASLSGLTSLTVSGNGPGKDLIERRAGTMAASQTWPLGSIPYVVTGSLLVEGSPMPVLTIQAGVTVRFNTVSELVVNYNNSGNLQAIGTLAAPILFTANGSTTPGFWYGLYFGANAGGATASRITYATVEYGGQSQYSRGGIYVWNSSPALDHVTLRNNLIAGVVLNGGSASITNSTITGNSGPGLSVMAGSSSISSTSITSNSGNGIDLSGGSAAVTGDTITNNTGYAISAAATASLSGLTSLTVSGNGPGKDLIERRAGTMAASQTWPLGSIPYVVTGSLYLEGSPMPVLTIQPGVTVKFNSASQLVVNYNNAGNLQAVGTLAAPILFTANGSTTPGFWYGLYVGANAGGATASRITYATVEYGGLTQYSRGGIHVWGSSPAVDQSTLRNNLIAGISIDGGSASITNTVFSGNPAGLIKTGAVATVSARFDYWGAASGPSGGGPGTGQSVAAGVTFEPWLVAAPSQPEFFNSFLQKNHTFNPSIGINTTLTEGMVLTGNWQVTILNAAGTTLRTFTGTGPTGTAVWNGKDASNVDQANGTYTYQLDGNDGAGHLATAARGLAIIDRTKQLAVSGLAVDQLFFSPNGDSIQDTCTVSGTNSFDDTTLTVNVKNPSSVIVRTTSSNGLTFSYLWDGKNTAGTVQPDGVYTFEVVATNGTAQATSTITTTLDNTPPAVSISAPANAQILSNVRSNGVTDIVVVGSAGDLNFTSWTLDYGAGTSPPSYTGISNGTAAVTNATFGTWATLPLANGTYTVRLQAWDKAGNHSVVQVQPSLGNFKLTQDVGQINTGTGALVSYSSTVPFQLTETLVLKNQAGQTVRTLLNAVFRPNPVVAVDTWNGRSDAAALLPDGGYFAVATVVDPTGPYTFTLDQTNQFIDDGYQYGATPGASYDFFNNRPLSVSYNFSRPGRVSVGFSPFNADPHTGCPPPEYCLLLDKFEESGAHTVYFAGADSAGRYVGTMLQMSAWSLRSNFSKNAVVLFGTAPKVTGVTLTPAMYGPAVGTQSVAFDLTTFQNQPVTVTVMFTNHGSASTLRTLTLTNQAPGHVVTSWDGKADNGMWVAPGFYTVTVTATDSIGNRALGQILTTVLY